MFELDAKSMIGISNSVARVDRDTIELEIVAEGEVLLVRYTREIERISWSLIGRVETALPGREFGTYCTYDLNDSVGRKFVKCFEALVDHISCESGEAHQRAHKLFTRIVSGKRKVG